MKRFSELSKDEQKVLGSLRELRAAYQADLCPIRLTDLVSKLQDAQELKHGREHLEKAQVRILEQKSIGDGRVVSILEITELAANDHWWKAV